MENTKEKINWKQIIISSVAPSLVVALAGYVISFFVLPNLSFSISESTYFEDNYITTISIESTSDKVYRDVEIYITNNTLKDIQSASDINHEGNNISVSEIAPKSTDSFMIISEDPIAKDTFFVNEDYSVNIYYPFSEPTWFHIITIYVGITFIMTFISTIILDKLNRGYIRKNNLEWDRKLKLVDQKNEEIRKEILEQHEDTDELCKKYEQLYHENEKKLQIDREEIKDIRKYSKKTRIYYQIKTFELNKELSFWRNTVRKLLYSKEDKFKEADSLIETVTNELKTYTTLEKAKIDIDKEFFIARMIDDKVKDDFID